MQPAKLALIFLFIIITNQAPNLHIGTGGFGFGCGSNSPAAQIPYSFVRLGPDTSPAIKKQYEKFQHYGGYHDSDHAVRAFSHMHLVGAGVIDMGILGILPIIPHNPSQSPQISQDRITSLSKEDQVAVPGYYSTLLQQQNIKVQLTTTQRCGVHRYTYTHVKNKPMDIHIMTSYLLDKQSPRATTTTLCGQKCVEGSIKVTGGFGGRFGGYTVHYHLELVSILGQTEPTEIYLYKDRKIVGNGQNSVSGNHTGSVIRTKSNIVQIYVGLSYVSMENARINFNNEVRGKNFNTIKKQSETIWTQQLKRFDISALTPSVQTKVDTAVYRTLLTPTIFQDSNGQYLSFANDGSKRTKPSSVKHVYTDMSLWDIHRTQMPWILFHDPQRFADIAMSIVLINREGGYMPKWPFAQGATGCMIGSHANTVLADWIIKQAYKDQNAYNISEILGYMLRNANTQTPHDSRSQTALYPTLGYIPRENHERDCCSETLQYSYNDFGISQVAKLLNQNSTAQQFLRRSKFYKNVWNSKSKFFEPRFKNGTFFKISKFERINIFSNNYVEGDAWHYRFYAPHDPSGLIQLFGGEKIFIRELDKFFSKNSIWPTKWFPDPYYWPGNQHDLFSVWLFPYGNRSDLTQRYSRSLIDTAYGLDGAGLPGNDDYATMSAWLIWACLGFYPLPSTPDYILGSPYINYARINRKISKDKILPFRIRVNSNSKSNVYVKKVQFNKQQVTKNISLNHFNFNEEVSLEFWMKRQDNAPQTTSGISPDLI